MPRYASFHHVNVHHWAWICNNHVQWKLHCCTFKATFSYILIALPSVSPHSPCTSLSPSPPPPPPPSLSLSDRHGCLFVLVQARLANRDWSKEVGSSDVAQEDFVVQHDMENCYMWVFKDRPQFALGKMQLRSYMNGHSR